MSTALAWSSWSTRATRWRIGTVEASARSLTDKEPRPTRAANVDLPRFREAYRRARDSRHRAARDRDLRIDRHRQRDRAARGEVGQAAPRDLFAADSVAEVAGRAAPRAPALQQLCRRDGRRFRGVGR